MKSSRETRDKDVTNIIREYSEMADDFFLSLLLLKKFNCRNKSILFQMAHIIELASKCALLKLDNHRNPSKLSHKIREIFGSLKTLYPSLVDFLPEDSLYSQYRKIYIQDAPNQSITLPPPEQLYQMELCFIIENITDLKYGFDKEMKLVSAISIDSPDINYKFTQLFKELRKIYSTEELNKRIWRVAAEMGAIGSQNEDSLKEYFGL